MEQIDRIKIGVSEYARKNNYLIPYEIYTDKSSLEHIIEIGTSIMCTKWEVGYPGGGFVQAVVNNNLDEAISRADKTCVDCLKFFSTLKNCLGYIE